MTRKDFRIIAAALARSRPLETPPLRGLAPDGRRVIFGAGTYEDGTWEQWLATRRVMIRALAATNPLFDRERFEEATEA